jgi:hypothetical protein
LSMLILTGSLFAQGGIPGTTNLTHSWTFNDGTANDYLDGRSPSFQNYINPIIPGDHPDPTLTKIGNYFYTSGSSFNQSHIQQ